MLMNYARVEPRKKSRGAPRHVIDLLSIRWVKYTNDTNSLTELCGHHPGIICDDLRSLFLRLIDIDNVDGHC